VPLSLWASPPPLPGARPRSCCWRHRRILTCGLPGVPSQPQCRPITPKDPPSYRDRVTQQPPDPNSQTDTGTTPLIDAAQCNHLECLRLLVEVPTASPPPLLVPSAPSRRPTPGSVDPPTPIGAGRAIALRPSAPPPPGPCGSGAAEGSASNSAALGRWLDHTGGGSAPPFPPFYAYFSAYFIIFWKSAFPLLFPLIRGAGRTAPHRCGDHIPFLPPLLTPSGPCRPPVGPLTL